MVSSPYDLEPEDIDGQKCVHHMDYEAWNRWAQDAYMKGALVNIWIAYTTDGKWRVRMHRDHYVVEQYRGLSWDDIPSWIKVARVPRSLGHRTACDVMERRALVSARAVNHVRRRTGMARTDRGAWSGRLPPGNRRNTEEIERCR